MYMMALLNPTAVQRAMAYRARNAIAQAVPFDKMRLPRGRQDVGVIASTFNPDNPLDKIFDKRIPKKGKFSPSKTLRYQKIRLPKGLGLTITGTNYEWEDPGRVFFDDDVDIPVLMSFSIEDQGFPPGSRGYDGAAINKDKAVMLHLTRGQAEAFFQDADRTCKS